MKEEREEINKDEIIESEKNKDHDTHFISQEDNKE